MRYQIFTPVLLGVLPAVTGCFQDNPNHLSAASCPAAAVSVLNATYNQDKGEYLIFHSAPSTGEKIANPIVVENLQMAQIQATAGETAKDFARLNFRTENGECKPILEMTQGYKIELASGSSTYTNTQGGASQSAGGGGSYWAPFLMGALVGNAVSQAMQPRMAGPAYYLPPPASSQTGGLVTGGVSGQNPQDLNKKYESTYKQSAKKGFFSKPLGGGSFADQGNSNKRKEGFFSKETQSNSGYSAPKRSRKSGGFFRKR